MYSDDFNIFFTIDSNLFFYIVLNFSILYVLCTLYQRTVLAVVFLYIFFMWI